MLTVPGQTAEVTIYYDGDCPFCTDYVRFLRLKDSVGTPALVNLRETPGERATLEAEGFDLDRGMVADIRGTRYEGADALSALALLTTPSGVFNRTTSWLFSSPTVARFGYPILRAGRNAVLTILGRQPFRADDPGWQALFTVFSLVFGLFAVIHFFVYAFRFTAFEIYASTWLILLFGVLLMLNPGSKRWFALLIVTMAVDAWLHAPMSSNHTILKNFLLVAVLAAGIWHMLKGSQWSAFFRDVVPVGRVLLLVMYFYGVFHKVNEGFLDPEVSCAVALWRVMPWPIHLLDHPFFHYAAIYGTFAVETVIAIMLIVPRLRGWGIVIGIGFHGFLAFSAFAMYPAFSTLTIALHVLFLSPSQAERIVTGLNYRTIMAWLHSWQGYLLLALALPAMAWFAIQGDYNRVAGVWLLLAIPVLLAILFPGKAGAGSNAVPDENEREFLWSRLGWLNVIGVLFFLNCAMPYFGLKTAQAMNMFANLRVEGGVSNHLVLPWAPGPFGYVGDLAEITAATEHRLLERYAERGVSLVWYDLLNRLDRSPGTTVSFVRNGVLYEGQSAATLANEIAATLHPEWMRKWFHFRAVQKDVPPPCV